MTITEGDDLAKRVSHGLPPKWVCQWVGSSGLLVFARTEGQHPAFSYDPAGQEKSASLLRNTTRLVRAFEDAYDAGHSAGAAEQREEITGRLVKFVVGGGK